MLTLVEFFDPSPIKNLIGVLTLQPDQVIMVVDESTITKREQGEFTRYLSAYHKGTSYKMYPIKAMELEAVTAVCSRIAKEHSDLAFNLTGGGEIAVAAVTMFCTEYKLPAFFVDLKEQAFKDVIHSSHLGSRFEIPKLSVGKIIAMNGAEFKRSDHYVPDVEDHELTADINNIFEISIRHSEDWHGFAAYMQEAGKSIGRGGASPLTISAPAYIEVNNQRKVRASNRILKELEQAGAISGLQVNREQLRFRVKSPLILEQLKLQGSWLEQFCYINSVEMGYFDDVKMSVVIDADGPLEDFAQIQNEIDLICVKGISPIFVSCKSGIPPAVALSEIKLLAQKFGGETAKTVLVTAATPSSQNPSIYKRAMELGIFMIELADLSPKRFAKRMLEIAEDRYRYVYKPL